MRPCVTGAAVAMMQAIRVGLPVALCLALMPSTGGWAAPGDPRVRLEEPERGNRRFVAPAAIPIEARAHATRGRTIVKVDFFAEDQPIGQATAAPYETVWTQVPEGQYRLRARATDDLGATGWSASVLVRVNENREPRVRLVSPQRGQQFGASSTIEFKAQARDRDHNLAHVEFYANGVLLGTDSAPRFHFSWTGVAAGTYDVIARAVDSLGATDDSRVVTIVVAGNQAPSVALTSPADGAVLPATESLTLTAVASDPDGTVTQVEFFDGTMLVATVTTPPYTFTVNNVPAGSYSFTARATDNLGASTTSAAVSVAVNASVAQIYYIHADHLNTPRVITNAAQQVVWRWDNQEPFGNTVPDENPSSLGTFEFPIRMEGRTYFDKETNLLYNANRYRDPSIGRFPQADPLGLNGGDLSLYVLTKNNPLSFTDPDGLAAQMCCRVLNQFILGTLGRQRHCYFNVDGTTYGLYPEGNVGVPRINDPSDRGGICKDCKPLPCSDVASCIRDQHDFYPIGDYSAALGPNSNTYAGTIANACCQGGVPSGLGMAPSIGDTPPAHNPNKGKK